MSGTSEDGINTIDLDFSDDGENLVYVNRGGEDFSDNEAEIVRAILLEAREKIVTALG